MAIRVHLADDHTMFREGIASVLADYGSIEVVGQADNDEGAVELARLRKPDVVLMQVQMPISRAKENLLRMREVSDPSPKVVIVTMIEDPRQKIGRPRQLYTGAPERDYVPIAKR